MHGDCDGCCQLNLGCATLWQERDDELIPSGAPTVHGTARLAKNKAVQDTETTEEKSKGKNDKDKQGTIKKEKKARMIGKYRQCL